MRATPTIGTILLTLAACNRGAPESGANQAAHPPQAVITSKDGRAEIRTGGRSMAGLPAGIPAYPGADPSGSVQISGASVDGQGQGQILGFRTADPPAQVVDFYAAAAQRAGYRIANRMNLGTTTSALTAQRAQETLNVTATGAEGATQVQIIVAVNQR